jgi:hypothetical protein
VPHTPLTRQQLAAERRSLDLTSNSQYMLAVKVFVVNGWRDAEDGVPAGVYTNNVVYSGGVSLSVYTFRTYSSLGRHVTVLRFRLLPGACSLACT